MKNKIFSFILIISLVVTTFPVMATDISFEDLDLNTNYDSEFINNNLDSSENIYIENLEQEDFTGSDFSEAITNTINDSQQVIPKNFGIRNAILMSNMNTNTIIPSDLPYTTIDLTDLATGDVVTHDCTLYLVSNFDEDNHWQECSICGKIISLEPHNYVDNGWTEGSANNCSSKNVHLFSCNCGASYSNTIGRKEHNTYLISNTNNCAYIELCKVCSRTVRILHECIKSDGSRISCGNPGRCTLCGYNYSAYHVPYDMYTTGLVYCSMCNKYLGNVTNNYITYNSDGSITFYNSIAVNGSYNSLIYNLYNPNQGITTTVSKNGLSQTVTINFNQHYENKAYIATTYDFYQNGVRCKIAVGKQIAPENKPPIINSINTNNTDDWSTDSTINITGTENYCNSVYLTLKDTEDNIYLENIATTVNNGNWNYEIKPNIEVKENTEFILIVKDTLDNETTQSFYLSKIDNKPPTNIGDKETSTDWSKTKDYVATTTDYGIGQVSNSVNNTENYELATEEDNIFYKGYTFTGDVYGSTLVPIYSKDGLGNTSTQFIKVYNLDNTSPTIEKINLDKTLHNTSITIQANDFNTKLNAEGSGVAGYAITTNNIEPTDYQESNSFNITEQGTYYLWVKDLVGNITSKEIYLPIQYKVTINPDGGTWKGSTDSQEVILSSDEKYDLNPIPEKEGYTFTEWKVTGEGYITDDGELIITGSDVEVIPIWETNQYSVTYIDYDVTNNKSLIETIKQVDYNTVIRGFDLGNDISDNAYYNQYRLVSDTESKVTTSNNTVYRYFEFCYTEKSSHIDFNDNDNIDNLRPETYKLQLQLEDGTLIDEVTLPSDVTDYTFTQRPKYDINGTEYKYLITPIISDRYKVVPNPETGLPEIDYSSPEYSILIPKITTLDGKTGDLSYTLKVNSTLFYNDKIIITPENTFLLTDGISTLTANIFQNQTTFTKEDILNNQLTVTGDIQVYRKYFAGTWTGIFNFNIRYEVKN